MRVTIDDIEVTPEQPTTILKAAQANNIRIPTLCYHEILEPHGGCRICMVEILSGEQSKLVTACNTVVEDGQVISTKSEKALDARRFNLELLLRRCPDVKVVRELADTLGIKESRFGRADVQETCILCGLCTRVCSEVVGVGALSFAHRGVDQKVTTPFEEVSDSCILCGACALICPTGSISLEEATGGQVLHAEQMLGPAKPIAVPFLQAVPNVPWIDPETCIHFKTEQCKVCERICEKEAVNYEMQEEIEEIEVGNIIVATGFKPFDAARAVQYGYGLYDNVITSPEFEKMSNASGPTGGKILLKNGKPPESVAILHCIGSRDEHYNRYCSRVCCMYSMKFAHLVKEKTDAEVYELYIDMRAFGKGYEEFYERLMEEGAIFVRGRGAEVSQFAETPEEEGKLIVHCEDTLVGRPRRIPVDMVILSVALEAREDAAEVARVFNISRSADGFFLELHPKLAPVSTATDGVFLAGCAQGPKDIPDSVAQGSAAAAQALSLISRGTVEIDAATSEIDADLCAGCRLCNDLCPYSAITFNVEKKISEITEALCKGCGTCTAACPSGAARARHFTDQQIVAEIEGVLS